MSKAKTLLQMCEFTRPEEADLLKELNGNQKVAELCNQVLSSEVPADAWADATNSGKFSKTELELALPVLKKYIVGF